MAKGGRGVGKNVDIHLQQCGACSAVLHTSRGRANYNLFSHELYCLDCHRVGKRDLSEVVKLVVKKFSEIWSNFMKMKNNHRR